jgi:hypothetical protein
MAVKLIMGGDVVGLRETLQQALVNANTERFGYHEKIQDCESRLLNAKSNLEKVKANKIGAEQILQDAIRDHEELVKFSNKSADPAVRVALAPEINRLGAEQSIALRNSIRADATLQHWQSQVSEIVREGTVVQKNLDAATERWEQIRKQVDQLSASNQDA